MDGSSGNLKIDIRPATEFDVPLLLDFIKGIADFEGLADHVKATEESLKHSLFAERPYAEAVIADVDNEPAGFLIFFHNFSSFVGKPGIYIEDIYVHPEYRKIGVGKALMVYCGKLAKERNCGRLEWSVLEWNPARKFYEKLGGKYQDEWLIYRLDEIGIDELSRI